MPKGSTKKVVFISSFPPRKCGIATFTSDLIKNTAVAARGEFEPLVVTMRSEEHKYDDPVKFEIRQNVKSDYICAADYINFSHVDLVSVQHEFGLFGGDAGSYLSLLLKRLKAPVVTTLHTVLDNPSPAYHRSMVDVCENSYRVVTMNERGVTMLRDIYGIPSRKIELIPHGIPDLPFVDSSYYKHKFGLDGRRTILTFGLLNKNKGIEIMLKAMPAIVEADPTVMYIVLGMTHPSILKHDGESYRFSLQHMVKDLGLQDHVIFHNRFVVEEELLRNAISECGAIDQRHAVVRGRHGQGSGLHSVLGRRGTVGGRARGARTIRRFQANRRSHSGNTSGRLAVLLAQETRLRLR